MGNIVRFAAVVSLALALLVGDVGVCSGWKPAEEARMACCSDETTCPMHDGDAGHSMGHGVSQSDADRCCAMSDAPPQPVQMHAVAVGTPDDARLAPAPAVVLRDAWRTTHPIALSPVRRHVLLSVFLI